MIKTKIKKILAPILMVILSIQLIGAHVIEAATPFQAVDIWLTGPEKEVCGYSEQSFTLNWFEDYMVDETITITIPKKAAFLATLPNDLVYETDGVQKNVYNLEFIENDIEKKMIFKVQEPIEGSACTVSFKLRTPLTSKEMKVTAKVGDDSVPVNNFANFTSQKYAVKQGLTVETTADIILKDMEFDTFGIAAINCKPPEDHYRLSMLVYDSKDNKKVVNELSWVIDSERDTNFGNVNGRDYRFTNLVFPDKYKDGFYTVRVSLSTESGDRKWKLLDYAEKEILFRKNPPQTPKITRTPGGDNITAGQNVTVTASYIDPEGVPIKYEWIGRDKETQAYPTGKNVVQVRVIDDFGLVSPWAADLFFVTNIDGSGGMTLIGPDSTIIETGLEGYTIGSYVFTVPPVSGHSGNDFARVRGLNKAGEWVQVNYGTTSNGKTLSGTLPKGVYSQLEFYYYTNHTCMYKKSNITYSVKFDYADSGGGSVDGSHPVNSINIKNAISSLNQNEELQLIGQVLPDDASDKSLTWTSSNPSVASINSTGKITALETGVTNIKAASVSTPSIVKSFELTVYKPTTNVPVESLTLDDHNLTIIEGQTYNLTATVNPTNATNKGITWSSENSKIAVIDENGLITAVSGGAVNIRGVSKDNPNISDKCTVTVKQQLKTNPVADVTVIPQELLLKEGDYVQLTEKIETVYLLDSTFIETMDNNIVTVFQDGTVTAIGTGNTTIKISSPDNNDIFINVKVSS